MFQRICIKSITNKLGCMTSVNIWEVRVDYNELTSNERLKQKTERGMKFAAVVCRKQPYSL